MKKIIVLFSIILSTYSYSQEWILKNTDISRDGLISEEYENREIFDEDFEEKTIKFHQSVLKNSKIKEDELNKMNGLDIYEILYMNKFNYDGSLPESFSKGIKISSLNEEFLLSNAHTKELKYLPDWSLFKASFEVGAVGEGISNWRGKSSIALQVNKDKSTSIELIKFIRIDRSSSSFESNKTSVEIKYWNEGQMLFNVKTEEPYNKYKCSTKSYKRIKPICTNGKSIEIEKISILLNAIEKKDSENILKDWIYKLKLI